MDPFTIHCSSCQSRIRVRNPSMIGQIANCPKCGSMIMITAPQPATLPQQILVDSPSGSVTDSVAVTKEALPIPNEGLLGDAHPLEQGFDHAFRSEGLPDVGMPEPASFESLSPTSWMPEPTPPPRADEVPSRAAPASNSRQIMLVAAIGLCSVVLACGVFFAFLRWYPRPQTISNKQGSANGVAANESSAGPAAVSAPAIDPAPAANPSVAGVGGLDNGASEPLSGEAVPAVVEGAGPDASGNDQLSLPTSEPPATNSAEQVAGAGPPTSGAVEPNALELETSDTGTAAATGAPLASIGSGAPLGSQLAPDIDSTFAEPGDAADAVDVNAVKESLPPGLQSFASIFDQSLVPVLSDATVPLGAAPEAGDDQPAHDESASAASPMHLALPETLEQKQSTTISGLLIQKRQLADVLSDLSLTSDIPFTVDLDGLMAAGVDRNLAVNFKSATPVTVQDVIGSLAEDYNLSFEAFDKKLFIVRGSASTIASRVPASLPIADLVEGADQTAALSAALTELLPELGDGLQLTDGAAQGDFEKVNRLLWFQVARVLESWRAARGLENADSAALVPATSRLPAWPVEAAEKASQRPMSQMLLPRPLAHSWQRRASEAGMTCWVDWPSLISAQTSPAQIGMVISRGRPLQELLQHDADKYNVVFAIEDERTLWATSPEMHRFQPRLYVLPMAGKSIEEWRKELEPLTPFNPNGSAALKVVAAPDGQFIFVRCCRPVLAEPQL